MTELKKSPVENGALICDTLKKMSSHFPDIRPLYPQITGTKLILTNEFRQTNAWDYFVQFPKELVDIFPGSYIPPKKFLAMLNDKNLISEQEMSDARNIFSNYLGTPEDPIFAFEKNNFKLNVLNGLSNVYALRMSYLASQVANNNTYPNGFADDKASEIRAQYQKAMHANIEAELSKEPQKKYAIRIHDDCLASGDSIVSYLASRMQDTGELSDMRKRGVKIVIDGAATAQGILYLQTLSKAKSIPIDITVGHMAFGLNAGEEQDGIRKHANYITYPQEKDFQELLPKGVAELIDSIKLPDGESYVVGDMGEAEKGIDAVNMKAIRELFGAKFCPWNDLRDDTHGPHKGKGISIQAKSRSPEITDHVYFARGGYLPYAFDKMYSLSSVSVEQSANIIIMRASRLFVVDEIEGKKLGYGAGFGEAEGVRYVN